MYSKVIPPMTFYSPHNANSPAAPLRRLSLLNLNPYSFHYINNYLFPSGPVFTPDRKRTVDKFPEAFLNSKGPN